MSSKETNLEDDDEIKKVSSTLYGKNYITPLGWQVLHEEFLRLKNTERPEVTKIVSWAAGNGDRSENGDYTYGKKRLREIDKRLRYLAKRIESAEVIDPEKIASEEVKFGATVTIINEENIEKTYHIVGIDESEPQKCKISWQSPLAASLMKKKEGDWVTLRTPSGVQELEIVKIEYKKIS